MNDYLSLRVARVIEETVDARSLVFDIPEHLAERFRYQPGQFLTLRVPFEGGWLPRCYSLSSTPLLDEPLRVTVKRVREGRASNWLCEELQEGQTLEVLPPAGVFVPRSLDSDLLLFGGGSGVTPVLSILRSALLAGTGRILLIYANRDEQSVIFRDELRFLANAHPQRLQIVHWLDSVQGVPATAQLAELARPFIDAQAFICGPAPFMDAAVAALKSLGMPTGRVHVERFVSLPGEGEALSLVVSEAAMAAQLAVRLDGEDYELPCDSGETVLDAMQRAGLNPPSACRVGGCASCMCTLESGAVDLLHNDALDAGELAEGWILACQAVPTTAQLRIRFPE
ncbi:MULTISPECIES: ferredoxin--NADP reductase [unclassified Pseudomonas]|uniref:ferredoxin--NADP reductase n=1 Tax=unclassified Pseudomonas TaxID=196821 RepID=UPI0021C669A4|nr:MULTISPECIES: ferredoxin--NADP reductase [unclassified Pseudomonas]MCU1734569.1 ferredoxin--NADP reductase [Pseudomonas sp. 20P_3.2_Bac4]MCU1742491.1 ferredoxin--NADP reductase [Pseudomonas sp. 20P_3.2_Bac5]